MKSLANKTAYGIILILLLTDSRGWSTSVAVAFTPTGIVVGTDSEVTIRDSSNRTTNFTTTKKFFIVQNRIVVFNVYASDIVFIDRQRIRHYNFPTWMNDLQGSIPANVTVSSLAEIIKTESAKVLAFVPDMIAAGKLKQEFPLELYRTFAQFMVVGYDAGIPKFYLVQFDLLWDIGSPIPKFIGPRIIPYDLTAAPGNFQVYFFGFQESLADLNNRHSYSYQQTMRRCPIAFRNLIDNHSASLDEADTLVRAFIGIEESVKPNDVGGKIRIVNILPNGRADEKIDSPALGKTVPSKPKQGKR